MTLIDFFNTQRCDKNAIKSNGNMNGKLETKW